MSQYLIKNIETIKPNWQDISALHISQYPWYKSGKQQETEVKLCANNDNLFIHIIARDKYSFAKQTQLNHMLICEDSCVEFFFSPSGQLGSPYVNLEVNCCGTLHLAYGSARTNREFISLAAASLITRQTSITSPVKMEKPTDQTWSVDITLPFSAIETLTGEPVNKHKWYGNFYRCGGRVEPQFAVWHNIDTPEPDYHRPEYFGELTFL
ncbi:carbohydrate-binding family 9-like protein [Colwelliaceae bacterium MEBiC 14330]